MFCKIIARNRFNDSIFVIFQASSYCSCVLCEGGYHICLYLQNQDLLCNCISADMIDSAVASKATKAERISAPPLQIIISTLHGFLALKYKPVWDLAIPVFGTLFKA